eukprot:287257-Amorphochlora_amoeboformis.AAC.1
MDTVLVSPTVTGVKPFAYPASPATWKNVRMAYLRLHATPFAGCSETLKRDDIKKAYIAIIKSTEIKSEVMSRIKERM